MPGLPKSIIKKYGISKKAWSVFRGRKRGSPKTRSVKIMAKRRSRRRFPWRRSRRRGSRKIPILPLVSLAPPIINLVEWVAPPLQAGNIQGAAYNGAYSLLKDFAGYDLNEKRWTGGNMLQTYGTLFAGILGHMVASKLGVNRTIAKIPIIGKWIQL